MTQPINVNLALTQRIMRRVYVYWFLKKVAPVFLAQIGVLAILLVGVHEYVSIRFVGSNALIQASSIRSFLVFLQSAFSHTEFVSRVLIIASALLSILIARDVVRFWRGILRRQGANHAALLRESLFR